MESLTLQPIARVDGTINPARVQSVSNRAFAAGGFGPADGADQPAG